MCVWVWVGGDAVTDSAGSARRSLEGTRHRPLYPRRGTKKTHIHAESVAILAPERSQNHPFQAIVLRTWPSTAKHAHRTRESVAILARTVSSRPWRRAKGAAHSTGHGHVSMAVGKRVGHGSDKAPVSREEQAVQ